jgi:hypothetical protein
MNVSRACKTTQIKILDTDRDNDDDTEMPPRQRIEHIITPKTKMMYAELVWLVKLGFHRSQTESKESRAVFKRGDGASVPAAKGLLLV